METGHFFWSFSRHRLFRESPEKYFFKYCVNPENSPESVANLANMSKKMLPAEEWICCLIRNEILEHIKFKLSFASESERLKNFEKSLFQKFRREIANFAIAKKRFEKKQNISEILESPEENIPQVLFEIENKLRLLFARFADSPLARSLLRIQYMQIKDYKTPDCFYHCGIKIWVAPDLAWADANGKLNILKFHPKSYEEMPEWDLQNGVYAIFANKKFHIDLQGLYTTSLFFCIGQEECAIPVSYYRNSQEVQEIIISDVQKMLDFEHVSNRFQE